MRFQERGEEVSPTRRREFTRMERFHRNGEEISPVRIRGFTTAEKRFQSAEKRFHQDGEEVSPAGRKEISLLNRNRGEGVDTPCVSAMFSTYVEFDIRLWETFGINLTP